MSSDLRAGLADIKDTSYKISSLNTTKKTTGGKYPIQFGYAETTRRPVEDILKWMAGVEKLLETLIEEVEA